MESSQGRDRKIYIEALKAICESISKDADEIIGNIENTREITINININPNDIVNYTIIKDKFLNYER